VHPTGYAYDFTQPAHVAFNVNSYRAASVQGGLSHARNKCIGTAKKVITFQRAMTKKARQFCSRKNRMTPSVAAPGDTNSSDATEA